MRAIVELGEAVRGRITALARQSTDGRETGGILLGRGPDRDGRIEITEVGDSGPRATRRPDFFRRDLAHSRALAERAWRHSRSVWVGEWHTHPAGDPRPSAADLRTYCRLLSGSELDFEAFVAIIVIADPHGDWEEAKLHTWVLSDACEDVRGESRAIGARWGR